MKKVEKKKIEDSFGFKKIWVSGLVILAFLIISIFFMDYLGLNRIRQRSLSQIKRYMSTLLDNVDNSLNIWIDHNLKQLDLIVHEPQLLDLVEKQLLVQQSKEDLMDSEGLVLLRDFFQNKRIDFDDEGFFVISPDRINIASRRDNNLGEVNLIERAYPQLLADVFQGNSRFIPPIRSDVFLSPHQQELPPTMFFAVPLFNKKEEVIAAITLRGNPNNEFSRFCEQARIGASGETYAFDENGLMLSESRFSNFSQNQSSILKVEINNSLLWQEISVKGEAEKFDGYADYRDREVFGIGFWNNRHHFGVITEVDADEALEPFYTVRFVLFLLFAITFLLALGSVIVSILLGQRFNRKLEERVEKRTAELKKSEERSQSLLEAAPDGMIIVDSRHIILQVNNQTEKLFGYSREELLGREIEILVPHMQREAHVHRRDSYIENPSTRAMGAIMEIKAQRKDGSTFPADIGLSPIRTSEGLLVVSSVRDITERKKTERAIQENEQKFKALFEKSTTAIVIFNDKGILECNDEAVKMMGAASRGDMMSRHPAEFSPLHQPDGRLSSEKSVEMDRIALQKGFHRFDWTHKRIDTGEIYPVEVSLSRITLNGEEVILTLWHDLTERKEYEDELSRSNSIMNALIDSPSDIIIFSLDGDYRYTAFNKNHQLEMEKIYGSHITQGMSMLEAITVDELKPAIQKTLDRVLSGESFSDISEQPDSEIVYESNWNPVKDDGGSVVGISAFIRDISEQRKIDRELKESQVRFELAVRGSGDALWEYDSRTEVNWFSPRFVEMLGYEMGELPDTLETWENHVHPDDRQMALEAFTRHLKEDVPYDIEYRMRMKRGEYRWFRARAKSLRDDQGIALRTSGSVSDIHDRKMAEEEVGKLSIAVEQSPLSIVITDLDGRIEYVNPAFQHVTGYTEEEALGQNPSVLNARVQPKEYYQDMWHVLSSGKVWDGQFCNLKKNGEMYWEAASIAPIKNEKGIITHYMAIKEDITEQKKDREELELLNQLVFGSLESADIGAWWIDFNEEDTFHALDTTVKLIGLEVNERGDKSYKISQWVENLNKTGESDPQYQLLLDETFKQFSGAISGQFESYRATYPVLQKDGTIKWIAARAEVPKRKEDGSALLMTGTLIDITEIKQNQDELNRQKIEAELIQEVTEIASVSHTIEISLSRCLSSICRSLNWPVGHVYLPSNEVEGVLDPSRIWFLFDENLYKTFKEVTEQISFKIGEGLPGRIWEKKEPVWITNVHKDPNFPRNKLVKDLGVKGAFGFPIFLQGKLVAVCEFFAEQELEPDMQMLSLMDSMGEQIGRVFERKAAENEIRTKHHQLERIIEEMPVAAAHFDPKGHVVHINKVAQKLLGYSVEDIPTVDHHWELFYPDPEYRAQVQKDWTASIDDSARTGEPMSPMFLDITTKSGTVLKLMSNTVSVGDLAITMWIDLTERENYEKALERARDAAEEATKAKSDFLANMSHEIRTPMNAIIGLSHLMDKTDLSRKQGDYLQKISGSARNLLGIINDILDFSKIEAGKLSIEKIDFDLNDVFDNLGSMMGNKTRDKGLELIFNVDPGIPPNLAGDPLRLGQVLLNLTNNAVKFTETGEIVVAVEEIARDGKDMELRFSIRDTGIGLTEEQAGNLFQAFSQADTSTTRKYGGTGLGLSISKKLVELMNGAIGVDSEFGEGSTFYFTAIFPYELQKARNIVPEEINNLKVLIVDDNATSREVLSHYCQDFSFHSSSVDSGKAALDTISQDPSYDLILMDYVMPGWNGYETAAKINEILPPEDRPKYILVTSFGRDEILDAIDDSGFSGFVLKPVNQSLLFNTIVEAFGYEVQQRTNRRGERYPEGFDLVRGASILLAEDNEINQQVATEMLTSEGFYVDVASNGEEAVSMIKQDSYDIILMDLQMPVLDGYGATEKIRLEKGNDDLPIVAMTADAMTGVRDNVLEIGMNDYITKPIDTNQLWQTLVKWVSPGDRVINYKYQSGNDNGVLNEKLEPIEGLDMEGGLKRVGHNVKTYKSLLCRFKEDFNGFTDDLNRLIEDKKLEEAVRLAHTLKGVSANLGAEEISSEAEKLEKVLKEGRDTKVLSENIGLSLIRIFEQIEISSGFSLTSSDGDERRSVSSDELKEQLLEALDSLKKRKPKPALEILDLLILRVREEKVVLNLKESQNLLSRYMMKDAAELLQQILNGETDE